MLPRNGGRFTRYNDNVVLRASCTCDRSADIRDSQTILLVPNPKPFPPLVVTNSSSVSRDMEGVV